MDLPTRTQGPVAHDDWPDLDHVLWMKLASGIFLTPSRGSNPWPEEFRWHPPTNRLKDHWRYTRSYHMMCWQSWWVGRHMHWKEVRHWLDVKFICSSWQQDYKIRIHQMIHASSGSTRPKLNTIWILMKFILAQSVVYLSFLSNLTIISMNPPWVILLLEFILATVFPC
jgi:hypothetical protein